MHLIAAFLQPLYHLLYHQFAWSYDLVAQAVSLGRWQDWIRVVLPRLHGRVLELGYGPGHLQQDMLEGGLLAYGLDESRAMARIAAGRLRRLGSNPRILRGYAQAVPFPAESFTCVVATFPSEYIFDPESLEEIGRVLVTGGELLVLPMAWIEGRRPVEKAAAWLLRRLGLGERGKATEWILARFRNHGFQVGTEIVPIPGSRVLLIRAVKPS